MSLKEVRKALKSQGNKECPYGVFESADRLIIPMPENVYAGLDMNFGRINPVPRKKFEENQRLEKLERGVYADPETGYLYIAKRVNCFFFYKYWTSLSHNKFLKTLH